MPNKKISELDPAISLVGDELVELVQAGANVQATVAEIVALAGSGGGGGGQPILVETDFGAMGVTGTANNYSGGAWLGNLVTVLDDGVIESVVYGLNANEPGINAIAAIYANNAGAAGALLASSNPVADAFVGDNVLQLTTPLAVTAGQQLWIGCYQASTGSITAQSTSGPSVWFWSGNLPLRDPGGGLTQFSSSMRIFGRGTTSFVGTDRRFRLPFFFTSAPVANEKLSMIVADIGFVIPPNFGGQQFVQVGQAPAATFVITVNQNNQPIGYITLNTNGSVARTTVGGTSKTIAAGDLITFVAPASVDATVADVVAMLWGITVS